MIKPLYFKIGTRREKLIKNNTSIGRVDRASATETVDPVSIPGRVNLRL